MSARRGALLALTAAALMLPAGCHRTPPPTPLEQLNTTQVEGYNVFQGRCAVCHNERSDEAKHGPALNGIFKKTYLPSGAPANDERVAHTVLHGRGMMPGQPNMDPDALAALLAYLHTV